MKKLIVLLILSLTTICYAEKPLTISIYNTTDQMVIVYIDSIDHGIVINGRVYPSPMPVCGGEIDAHGEFILQPRKYNLSPYRYILTVCRIEGRTVISKKSTVFIIAPPTQEHIITIGDEDG